MHQLDIPLMEVVETWLNQAEAFRREHGRPWVSLCYAQSLDGCISAQRHQRTVLSGLESSQLTHQLRAAHEAILVGVGTVLSDDPLLTVRLVKGKHPQPVILDSQLRFPLEAQLLTQHPLRPWIVTTAAAPLERQDALKKAGARLLFLPPDKSGHPALPEVLKRLAEMEVSSLMVEGGARIISNFLAQNLVDQVILTVAPIFLGGVHAVEQTTFSSGFLRLSHVGYQRLGEDIIVWGRLT